MGPTPAQAGLYSRGSSLRTGGAGTGQGSGLLSGQGARRAHAWAAPGESVAGAGAAGAEAGGQAQSRRPLLGCGAAAARPGRGCCGNQDAAGPGLPRRQNADPALPRRPEDAASVLETPGRGGGQGREPPPPAAPPALPGAHWPAGAARTGGDA